MIVAPLDERIRSKDSTCQKNNALRNGVTLAVLRLDAIKWEFL